jgi:hypothetical protein
MVNNHATSGLTPTLPTGYVYKRRVASRITVASSLVAQYRKGDYFGYEDPIHDADGASQGTTAVLYTLSVPKGVQVWAHINFWAVQNTDSRMYVSSPSANDEAPSATAGPLFNFGIGGGGVPAATMRVLTDTSGRIRVRGAAAGATLDIVTLGYEDDRARFD